MRSPLFRKLFGLQLLAGLALFAVALGAMRLESAQNFSDYLDAQRRELLRATAQRVADAYRVKPDLRAAAAVLPRQNDEAAMVPAAAPLPRPVPEAARPRQMQQLPPLQGLRQGPPGYGPPGYGPPPPGYGPPGRPGFGLPGMQGRPPPRGFGPPGMNGYPPPREVQEPAAPADAPVNDAAATDTAAPAEAAPAPAASTPAPPPVLQHGPQSETPPLPPMWLLDANELVVGGSRRPLARSELLREPVQVDGRTVGWLVQPRQGGRNTAAERDFAQRQACGLWLGCALAVVVAALIAAITSTLILRRVRRLSEGAAALAQRDFALRLEPGPADELGAVALDFNRLAEALERYDLQQQQWLADVAHELRTPLAVLRGELEALQDGVRTADAAAIRSLQQEVQRLTALADDLHLLSLAESGGLRIARAPVDAAALLEQTAARYLPRMSAGRFALERVVQPGLPPFLGDEQRIGQVLANLLENVLRHARAPGQVSLSAVAAPKAVRIAVADSGPGVPDTALPRLFDRLYRVDAARTRAPSNSGGGSGLGLAICRSIVEAHGGSIVARHSRRGGLEVELTLPVAAA